MKKTEKRLFAFSIAAAMLFVMPSSASAMHIMEGYLPMGHAIAWGALCLPFLVAGFISIKKTISQHRKALLILAMAGAYAFVLSALKIPSVTGSSSHPTGTGLGAILFGPSAMSVIGIIVLLFQALLLAHGGLTTLGANTFSMAIAGPFLSYGIYRLGRKLKINKSVCVFLATCLGDLFTYCVTSVQLGFAHPAAEGGVMASITTFMGIFAVTQIPLAIVEVCCRSLLSLRWSPMLPVSLANLPIPSIKQPHNIREEDSMTKSVKITIAVLLLLCVIIAVFPLMSIKDSEFGGADGAAEEAISEIDPGYEPWAESILEPPGGETESLLFCLQAALGSGVLFFGFGYLVARKKYKKD